MQLEVHRLIQEVQRDGSVAFGAGVRDQMSFARHSFDSMLEKLDRHVENVRRLNKDLAAASFEIREACKCSRVLHEKAMELACGGDLGAHMIGDCIRSHRAFLATPVVAELSNFEGSIDSLPYKGRECSYVRNVELRTLQLQRLKDAATVSVFAGVELAPFKPDDAVMVMSDLMVSDQGLLGEISNADNCIRRHFLWISEFFRSRLDVELVELSKEVDSLRDAGDYHVDVLTNINAFVSLACEKLKENGAHEAFKQPRFLPLVKTLEGCISRVATLLAGLQSFIKKANSDPSIFEIGGDFAFRKSLWENLFEVAMLLFAVSRELVGRRSFCNLFTTGTSQATTMQVICYPSKSAVQGRGTGPYIAQCLNLDVVAGGKTVDSALEELNLMLCHWVREFNAPQFGWIHPVVAPVRFYGAFADGKAISSIALGEFPEVTLEVRVAEKPITREYKSPKYSLAAAAAKK
jgi:hypothetical protein